VHGVEVLDPQLQGAGSTAGGLHVQAVDQGVEFDVVAAGLDNLVDLGELTTGETESGAGRAVGQRHWSGRVPVWPPSRLRIVK
jgi:hypothetical protein